MKRVNYHLTDSQLDWLRKQSDETGLSVAELIRRALDEAIRKAEKSKKKDG